MNRRRVGETVGIFNKAGKIEMKWGVKIKFFTAIFVNKDFVSGWVKGGSSGSGDAAVALRGSEDGNGSGFHVRN